MSSSSPSATTSHDDQTVVSPPRRFIYNDDDLEKFLESPAKRELLQVISVMGKSCASRLEYEYDPDAPLIGLSPALAALHGMLRGMLSWIQDFPPGDFSQARFGNPAFRKWHQRLVGRSVGMVRTILQVYHDFPDPKDYDVEILEKASQQGFEAAGQVEDIQLSSISDENDRLAIEELCAYFHDCFGHHIRLDYGTGHESSFQVFLYTLLKLGCFGSTKEQPPTPSRLKAATVSIYTAYLQVTRQLQTDYMLEPAGSHGVWGLDDYHCLPFYFGACQLAADGEEYTPKSIHDDNVLRREGDRLLYFGCIRYIKTLKKGVPFFESSPMLNDISQLPTWQKVYSGLLLLYEGEVLKKRQVVQHFVFGNIFSANWSPSDANVERQAPQETFRTTGTDPLSMPSASTAMPPPGVSPMARAPWATSGATLPGSSQGPTKAPWAKYT